MNEAGSGDLLVFRMRDGGVAKHAGVLVHALPAFGLLERDVGALRASLYALPLRCLSTGALRNPFPSTPIGSTRKELLHEHCHLAHHWRLCQRSSEPILGVTAALSTIGLLAVGEMSLPDLIATLPIARGGLGLAALGAKVDDASVNKPGVVKSARRK